MYNQFVVRTCKYEWWPFKYIHLNTTQSTAEGKTWLLFSTAFKAACYLILCKQVGLNIQTMSYKLCNLTPRVLSGLTDTCCMTWWSTCTLWHTDRLWRTPCHALSISKPFVPVVFRRLWVCVFNNNNKSVFLIFFLASLPDSSRWIPLNRGRHVTKWTGYAYQRLRYDKDFWVLIVPKALFRLHM